MHPSEFEEFLSTNERRIFNYLLSLLGNEADAQDVFQLVFIAFYEHIHRIERATAVNYVYRIAYNKSMTFLKQKSRFVDADPKSFEYIPDTSKPPEEPDYTALNEAIRSLPPRLAAVIQLQYYEKLSYKEIAEELGTTLKAVESLLVRAKKHLRKKLMQETGGRGV
ncbi:MAG: sigma-70 family RNA polymerase sigma factor [Candidatus Cloacimonetes bacterium]|nr:sigma-70 family RNA polymerase sigma factor [Candidatus Cloacimonadota bacterium]NLO10908.1 sigma-70 family RNA polymerase sigma factor [Candidatus Cloacimonadota bacterium]